MAVPFHLTPEQQPETALPHEFDQGIPPIWTKREKRLNKWTVYSRPAPPSNLTPRDLWGKRTPYFSNEEFRAVDARTRGGSAHRPRKRKDRPVQNFRNVTEATMQSHIRKANAEEGHRPRTGQIAFTMRDTPRDRKPVTAEEEAEYDIEIRKYPMGEKTAKRVRRGKEKKNELKRGREVEAGEALDGVLKKSKQAQRQIAAVDVSARGLKEALSKQKQQARARAIEEEKLLREQAAREEKALPTRLKESAADVEVEDELSEIPQSDVELEDAGE